MPAVVNQQTDRVELPSQYEWSWPDHPAGMSDSDARMRYPRGMREGSAVDAPLKDTDLAVGYGELLADGAARIQQKTYTGDNLPRDSFGSLLEVRQQMAAEIAERRNGLEPGAYTTDRTQGMREPGPIRSRYGATDGRQLATWVPSSEKPDRAIKAIRDNDAATNSRDAGDIASCIGKNLDDDGEMWRHAIKVGRSVTGLASALETAAQRAPENVKVDRSKGNREYSISVEKGQVTVNAPLPKGNRRADTAEELYAKARGTIAAAYGEPQNETEHALDALAASIVTSRGTNGCGLGWVPPEPDRLRAAGVELQRDPSRLAELQTHIDVVEKVFYPPWPGREMEIERDDERVEEEQPKDIFDYDRELYAGKHAEFGERMNQRSQSIIHDAPAAPPHERPRPTHDGPQHDRNGRNGMAR